MIQVIFLQFLFIWSVFGQENITFILQAVNLPEADKHSEIDPYVKIFSSESDRPKELKLIGQTHIGFNGEYIWYKDLFWINWTSGKGQKLHFFVYDHDTFTSDDVIGEATLNLDEKSGFWEELSISLSGKGSLKLLKTKSIYFSLKAKHLDDKDLGSSSDPYVRCFYNMDYWTLDDKSTKTDNGRNAYLNHEFYRTSVINNEFNPKWPELIQFPFYREGLYMTMTFKVKDSDTITIDDDLGFAVLKLDNFVEKNIPKILKLEGKGAGLDSTITIYPHIPIE